MVDEVALLVNRRSRTGEVVLDLWHSIPTSATECYRCLTPNGGCKVTGELSGITGVRAQHSQRTASKGAHPMFVRPVLAGVFRRFVPVAALVATALTFAVGTASAQPAEPAAVRLSVTHHVLGVPLGTATWALFGLILLIGGLFAASHSGKPGATANTLPPSRPGVPVKPESNLVAHPVADFGRTVSAVR